MKFAFFSFLFISCTAYKIVILAPSAVTSQLIFNARVGEALANAGHEVTLAIIEQIDGLDHSAVKFPANIHIYYVNASTGIQKSELEEKQSMMVFNDLQFYDKRMRDFLTLSMKVLIESCRVMVKNKEFLSWLESSRFDLAFVHVYQGCPVGLVHAAKIPTWIWLNSGALMDYVADIVGVPIFPSYVPPIAMGAHDEMTFPERIKSFLGHILMKIIWPKYVMSPEIDIFRQEIDPNFPDLVQLGASCPLVMVNSNPLYDLPRPTLEKVVNIGGVGAQLKDAKPLPKELEEFLQKGEGALIFSFGSVAPIHKAPESWKKAILAAFSRLPQFQFVMRYMGEDLNDRLPSNLRVMKWLPQSDLLQHPKIKAFISHGGYNGMQETIAAGKPMIMIPLYGDQPKNAKIGEKHGIAKILYKTNLTEDTLVEAILEVMTNPGYTNSARRLSQMVAKQPVSSELLLIKWTEFLAEFKTLENLHPAGQKLNFFQYYSLDVIGFLIFTIIFVFLCLFAIVRFILCKIYGKFAAKKKKMA